MPTGRNSIVPPLPSITVNRRKRELVDVFDGAPIRESSVFIASAALGINPCRHAYEAGGLIFLELSNHIAEAVADFFEALM